MARYTRYLNTARAIARLRRYEPEWFNMLYGASYQRLAFKA